MKKEIDQFTELQRCDAGIEYEHSNLKGKFETQEKLFDKLNAVKQSLEDFRSKLKKSTRLKFKESSSKSVDLQTSSEQRN